MKLDVPHYYQPKGSEYCGLASLRMVLAYYGHSISYKKLKKHITVYRGTGTFLAELGCFTISRGLKAEEWHHYSAVVNETLEQSSHLLRDLMNVARISKERFLYAWYQNHGFTLIVKK